jgi:transcriptional regulator with XRE-family HTH domain
MATITNGQLTTTLEPTLAGRVKQIRAMKGWSQADLGARAGCSRQTIMKLEAGSRAIQLRVLVAIAEALGVGVSDLVGIVSEQRRALPPEEELRRRTALRAQLAEMADEEDA